MGEQSVGGGLQGAPLRQFTRAVLDDLRALETMLHANDFDTATRRVGAEQEIFLVDEGWRPALRALDVLQKLDDPHFTTELAQFNLEMNLDPLVFEGRVLDKMEGQLQALLQKARAGAEACGTKVVLTGILPTIRKSDLGLKSMTPHPRYQSLNHMLGKLRGGPYEFYIRGTDELCVQHDNVMVESCNCSFQVHFQVGPQEFANLYNISQLAAGPILAAAVNSPLLFERRLWSETRIALFQQSVDTRGSSNHLRERAPRVNFGSRWVDDSVVELFREDIVRFRALMDLEESEDPFAQLASGEVPRLNALRLHNGTVYRWNRPCYGITDGKAHLRIENRILPSGPSVKDEIANAAFWFGLVSGLAERHPKLSGDFDFEDAKANFQSAARYGLSAQFEWFGDKTIPAQELIARELIPIARDGLRKKIDAGDIDEYLGIIEERVKRSQTGSKWILRSLSLMKDKGTAAERMSALTAAMVDRQEKGEPVAHWKLAQIEETGGWTHSYQRVEQFMSTDLFTVQEDESLDFVSQLMDWESIRHVPVEDHASRLVGLVSYRQVLRALGTGTPRGQDPAPVSSLMEKDLVTVSPETLTLEAIRLMRRHKVGCLPVVTDGHLVGIVTERDFMELARDLMEEALEGDDHPCE